MEDMAPKNRNEVRLRLPKDAMSVLDTEVLRARARGSKKRATRSSVAEEIVRDRLFRSGLAPKDGDALHVRLLADAAVVKSVCAEARRSGDSKTARRAALIAAALELEALAAMDSPSEGAVQSTVIEAVCLIKEASDYARLPDFPTRRAERARPSA